MKRSFLASLCAIVALTSCQTAHDAAVVGFRVIDAPHQYLRRKLDVDNDEPTTTTTTTTETNVAPNGNAYPPRYRQQPPPQRVVQRQQTVEPSSSSRTVMTERTTEPAVATPTPLPAVTRTTTTSSDTRTTEAKTAASSRSGATEKSNLPYAKPVPGKPGYVFSPFDTNGGYVDVTGFAPGSKVKDPYSGKVFLVP